MNENYKGSIELISGLKQKNDLDFPLMEASAVAFYDPVLDESGLPTGETQEIRLTEKIKQVGISDADKKQLIEDAVAATVKSEDFTTIETQVAENTANIETKTTDMSGGT